MFAEDAAVRLVAWLTRAALVLAVCAAVFLLAAGGRFSSGQRLEGLLVVGVGVTVLGVVAVRWPGWLPALVLLVVSVVPYQVSAVGKTPFGVVSAAGGVGAVGLACLLLRHARGRTSLLSGPEVAALLGWSAVLTASALLSPEPKHGLDVVRMVVVAVPVAYVAGRLVVQLDPLALRRVVLVAGVLSVLAILEELTRFTVYDLVPPDGFPLAAPPAAVRSGLERVRLGYYHASTLGTLLAVTAPVVVLSVGRARDAALRWVLPVLVVALVCTFTFQVWVATGVALLLLGLGLRRLRTGLVALGLVAGLVVASGAVPAVNRLIEDRTRPTGSASDEYAYRTQLWPAAVREASDGPVLGEGPGSFNTLGITGTVRNVPVRLVDDNTFTASLVETGYPGLVALALALLVVGRRMLRGPARPWAWAGAGALAAWTVMALSVEVFAGDQALLPCWLVLGMLSGRAAEDAG